MLTLVNNAGVRHDNLGASLGDDEWSDVLETNLTAAFRLTRRALKPMLRARSGRIVNISSVVGLRANPGQANYAAAKAGLVALTKTVAVEVARRGITVNAVAPGWIDTEMTSGISSELLAAVPARRAGLPGLPAPEAVKAAAMRAVDDDVNQYAVTWGSPALRAAIGGHMQRHYDVTIDADRQVTVCCGSTEAMIATFLATSIPATK